MSKIKCRLNSSAIDVEQPCEQLPQLKDIQNALRKGIDSRHINDGASR